MIIESGLVKAGLVKTGLVRAISNINTRYFRRNEGTTDYISHATATVDRIVMYVLPVTDNTGLPTGAPVVTAGVFQAIDFAFVGSISEIGKNGANYFAGRIANVEYYSGGTLIHGWKIESNSNDIPDYVGSNDGTVINGNASDWGLFQQQATGEWLGQELWSDGLISSLAPLTILADSTGLYHVGLTYRYSVGKPNINTNDGTGWNQSGGDFTRTSSGSIAVRNMSTTETVLDFTPSVKEVLNVA